MTNNEIVLMRLGAATVNTEECTKIELGSGRYIYKVEKGWEAQPWNDNYWKTFKNIEDAIMFAMRPKSLDGK